MFTISLGFETQDQLNNFVEQLITDENFVGQILTDEDEVDLEDVEPEVPEDEVEPVEDLGLDEEAE